MQNVCSAPLMLRGQRDVYKRQTVPLLKLTDPNTGEYVTLAEAKESISKELESKTKKIAVAKLPKVKKAEPRYRIMRDVLSAKSK